MRSCTERKLERHDRFPNTMLLKQLQFTRDRVTFSVMDRVILVAEGCFRRSP